MKAPLSSPPPWPAWLILGMPLSPVSPSLGSPPPPPLLPPGTFLALMAPPSGSSIWVQAKTGNLGKFWHPVSFSKEFSQKEFFLIASFGHCKHRLDPDSVALLLQAAIGGLSADFNVSQLSDQVFRFPVEKWVSSSINCNISNVITLKFSLICGIMVAPIGKKNIISIRWNKMILERLYWRKNSTLLMLLKSHHWLVATWFPLIIRRNGVQGLFLIIHSRQSAKEEHLFLTDLDLQPAGAIH
jgi:hypothetical protein